LYQWHAVFVGGKVGFFSQRPTSDDTTAVLMMLLIVMLLVVVQVVVMVPVGRPAIPILQVLVVLVRRGRLTTVIVVSDSRCPNDRVVPTLRRFQDGIVYTTTGPAVVRRFDQTVACVAIDG
jgi:hypothetical protein